MGNLEHFVVHLDENFPLGDIRQIIEYLENISCLVPGYVSPEIGLLKIEAIYYAQQVEQKEFVILLDRNLVSSLNKVVQFGLELKVDGPTKIAVNLMAFCQCLNIEFELAIALHEVAPHIGNKKTIIELGWFRIANESNPTYWIDLALGRTAKPLSHIMQNIEAQKFVYPLDKWRCNYVAALKIAELQLNKELSPCDKLLQLICWMKSEFHLMGSVMILAAIYFSPHSSTAGMFKKLHSENREKAILGIRNETWDIMYLSEFARKVKSDESNSKRYMFASADKQLLSIAPLLFSSGKNWCDFKLELVEHLKGIWSFNQANFISEEIIEAVKYSGNWKIELIPSDQIDNLIKVGENRIITYDFSS